MDLSQVSTEQLSKELSMRRSPSPGAPLDQKSTAWVASIGSQRVEFSDSDIRKAAFGNGDLSPDQDEEFEVIQRHAELLAEFIQKYCPETPDRVQALQQIRIGVHIARLSMAHEGVPLLR